LRTCSSSFDRKLWIAEVNCAGVDPELFFPQRGDPTSEAKAVCRACPIRAECLDYALSINVRHGIWGGTSERQRNAIPPAMDRKPAANPAPCPATGPAARHHLRCQ
jgi:WhiB family transcriptional regulator, redox-sensing transcriptional regulator